MCLYYVYTRSESFQDKRDRGQSGVGRVTVLRIGRENGYDEELAQSVGLKNRLASSTNLYCTYLIFK